MRQSTFARAAAAALVLMCSAPIVSAQGSPLPPSVSLRLGSFLGTEDLAVAVRNLAHSVEQEIKRLRAEQAEGDRRLQNQVVELQEDNRRLRAELDRDKQELRAELARNKQELLGELGRQLDRQKQELLGSMANQEAQFKRVIDKLDADLVQLRRVFDQLSGEQSALASDIRLGKDGLAKFQIDGEQLSARLNALQSQLGNLRETTTRIEAASARLVNKDQELGSSLATVTAAQNSLRDELTSQLAKSANELAQSASELEAMRKAVAELRATVAVLEAGLKGAERSANDVKEVSSKIDELKRRIEPVETTIDGRVFDALPAEVAAYKAAVGKVERGEFAAARVDLQQFLASVSNPGFRGSALYWLGQAQYASSQFREAQGSFGDMVKFSPDHPRAAEAMLAMANCQLELKEPRANVRRSLDNLIKLHPKSKAAAEAKELLARLPR
jgi:TolA-binding protein